MHGKKGPPPTRSGPATRNPNARCGRGIAKQLTWMKSVSECKRRGNGAARFTRREHKSNLHSTKYLLERRRIDWKI